MLIASSPIKFPESSSPPLSTGKRAKPHDAAQPIKPRARGGFLVDDDSDDEANDAGPPTKKRHLETDCNGSAKAPDVPVESAETVLSAPRDDRSQEIPDAQPRNDTADMDNEEARYDLLFSSAPPASLFKPLDSSHWQSRIHKLSTCSGKTVSIKQRKIQIATPYENMIAARSRTKEGRATRSYYGIDIHELVDGARKEMAEAAEQRAQEAANAADLDSNQPVASIEAPDTNLRRSKKSLLWTEKYRARNFMDLVGDDLTNRQVLRWLKRWDPVVFPHAAKSRPSIIRRTGLNQQPEEEKPHRKILLLTGAPGLGKTTLAHVCARQAGYEVLEINASDDRSRDVVKGRIRTTLGTESVKTVEHTKPQPGKQQRVARPVCVVVDEVDGVVSGSGASGEGGFVKALIDLVLLDQKNSSGADSSSGTTTTNGRRAKKGDDFRQMRPLILVCNDVYHNSLRPLRQSGLAEIIHVGKPSTEAVVLRLKTVFEKEGIPCERDAARKLCEAAWGMSSGIDARRGAESTAEGDLRGVMVVGEWVAGRLRSTCSGANPPRLTRQWVDGNVLNDLAHGGGGARGIGRGGVKDIVTRIFQEGAGFPKQNLATTTTTQSKKTRHEEPHSQLSFSEHQKKYAMLRLGEMVDTSGEVDRVMTDVFSEYPLRDFNDDCYLTKPNAAYEWMYFHDTCSHRIFSSQEWELGQYFSQPVLACHHLFASPYKPSAAGYDRKWGADDNNGGENAPAPLPFSGPRADFMAHEAEKQNRAALQTIQSQLPPSLMRSFRSPEHVATDFLPYLVRLVSPDVKPVVIGGSDKSGSVASVRREGEKIMVRRAAEVLAEVGIALQKGKIEEATPSMVARTQWVYRMDPDLDMLATFESGGSSLPAAQAPTRYAVRQVLDQELHKTITMRENSARQARFAAGHSLGGVYQDRHGPNDDDDKENRGKKRGDDKADVVEVKRDFFGRIISTVRPLQDLDGNARDGKKRRQEAGAGTKVWVTFHEGINNAVKKPISLDEFLRGL